MTQIAEHDQSERDKVAGWRLHVLMEAGYPLPLAERLAQSEADLHSAVELILQGHFPAQGGEQVPPATRGERIGQLRTRPCRKWDNFCQCGPTDDRRAEPARPRA